MAISRILLAATSYCANESINRLRALEASAIWADDGGRLGSLLRSLVTGLNTEIGPASLTVERLGAFGIVANADEFPFQIGSGSGRP